MEFSIVSSKLVVVLFLDNCFFGVFVFVIIVVVFGGFVFNWINNFNNIVRIFLWIGLYGVMSVVWYVLLFN